MLDQRIVERIAALIAAYQGERERRLDANLLASQRQLAARGMIGSGNTAHEFGRIAMDELQVRAGLIWGAIQRAHAAAGAPVGATTLQDLRQQLAHHINAQAAQARTATHAKVPPLGGGIRTTITTHIDQVIATKARESIEQLGLEADFYVDQFRRQAAQPAPAAGGNVTINAGHIGAVQTGAYAVAHVAMSAQDSARLVETLSALRQALQANAEATADQRAQGDELAGDLIVAVQAERPNGPKITGLLGGLATTVQTVASLRPAWELVRDAAIAAGIAAGLLSG